ncbi:MAG: hypothetical protein V8R90_06155 [Eubacterium sp.]
MTGITTLFTNDYLTVIVFLYPVDFFIIIFLYFFKDFLGHLIVAFLLIPLNAFFPIFSIFFPITTFFVLLQFLNAFFPIAVTLYLSLPIVTVAGIFTVFLFLAALRETVFFDVDVTT